jgi:hypothetical protein
VLFLWGSTLIGSIGQALDDIVSTLGLMAAINLILGGILPGLGAAFMAFVIIYSLATDSLNGVEIALGFGAALVGLILSFISQRVGKSAFYTEPTASHGHTVEAEPAGSA